MLNQIDMALQTVTPTVMVPRHEPFEAMPHVGHRFLSASDGLWLEARREWLYLRWPLAKQLQVAMPYGSLTADMAVRNVPRHLVASFVEEAKNRCPMECAAWIVWNSSTDQWKLIHMIPTEVGPAAVKFNRPALNENEHLVVDLHSHGRLPAFFSSEDDADDKGEFKIAGVFGKLDDTVECRFRLCANGLYVGLGDSWGDK